MSYLQHTALLTCKRLFAACRDQRLQHNATLRKRCFQAEFILLTSYSPQVNSSNYHESQLCEHDGAQAVDVGPPEWEGGQVHSKGRDGCQAAAEPSGQSS